jgi:hypothetical protein
MKKKMERMSMWSRRVVQMKMISIIGVITAMFLHVMMIS